MIETLKKSILVVFIYVFLTLVLRGNLNIVYIAGFFIGTFLGEMLYNNLHRQ